MQSKPLSDLYLLDTVLCYRACLALPVLCFCLPVSGPGWSEYLDIPAEAILLSLGSSKDPPTPGPEALERPCPLFPSLSFISVLIVHQGVHL